MIDVKLVLTVFGIGALVTGTISILLAWQTFKDLDDNKKKKRKRRKKD